MIRSGLRKRILEQVVNSLNEGGEDREAKRLSSCGNWFKCGRCPDGGHRLEPNPCNSMFCVSCAVRRSGLLQKRLLAHCRARGKRYYFLTLTVPNLPDLTRESLNRVLAAFALLRRSAIWKRVRREGAKWAGITGGVYSMECTFVPESNSWHPHIHALVEMPGRNPDGWLDDLKAEWLRITGNARVIHIEPVYGRSKRGKKFYRRVNLQSLKELVKYVTKAAAFAESPERVCEFFRAFQHVRRIQTFGSFHGVLGDPEREPGDDGCELKCSCGKYHYHSGFTWLRRPVHIGDTKVMPDGSRQLKFDFWIDEPGAVEESPPDLVLLPPEPLPAVQLTVEFSGALPEMWEESTSLFAA